MQDRTARSTKPLAPHGRTIHLGQSRHFGPVRRMSACPLTAAREQTFRDRSFGPQTEEELPTSEQLGVLASPAAASNHFSSGCIWHRQRGDGWHPGICHLWLWFLKRASRLTR